MNAYELADELDWLADEYKYVKESATMLRQQADRIAELEKELEKTSKAAMDLREIHVNRIAELEKVSSKPVAWTDMKDCVMEHHKQGWARDKLTHYTIPLYTHPHKELSDEEIAQVFDKTFKVRDFDNDFLKFARAIIKASRGEE